MFLILIVILLLTLLFCFNFVKHNYWANKGVYTPPTYPLVGHTHRSFGQFWEYNDEVYRKSKQFKFSGSYEFFWPKLNLYNPDLIRSVTVKDFDHFTDRRTFKMENKRDKVLNDFLTNATGDKWKFLRNMVTPSFTSGKLKGMFPLVSNIADDLVDQCKKSTKDGSSIEMHDMVGRYALDVIATVAFGIEGKSIREGESEFYKMMKSASNFNFFKALVNFFIFTLSPKLFNILGLSFFSKETLKLNDVVRNTLNLRRKEVGIKRGDFVDLILEAEKNADKELIKKYNFDEDSLIAQSVLFLFAGYDTINNTVSFLFNDLAKYPEEQCRIREEILDMTQDGELTYQNVMEAKHLDAFICESMRLTPSAYIMERACTQPYKIPGTEISLYKDQIVSIPVWSLHKDPNYWENPLEFRSERFFPENKDKIVPYTYLPFGIGPRNCIGNRLALMEMKIAVAKMLLAFEISLAPGFEMKLKKSPQTLRPDQNGLMINLKEL